MGWAGRKRGGGRSRDGMLEWYPSRTTDLPVPKPVPVLRIVNGPLRFGHLSRYTTPTGHRLFPQRPPAPLACRASWQPLASEQRCPRRAKERGAWSTSSISPIGSLGLLRDGFTPWCCCCASSAAASVAFPFLSPSGWPTRPYHTENTHTHYRHHPYSAWQVSMAGDSMLDDGLENNSKLQPREEMENGIQQETRK